MKKFIITTLCIAILFVSYGLHPKKAEAFIVHDLWNEIINLTTAGNTAVSNGLEATISATEAGILATDGFTLVTRGTAAEAIISAEAADVAIEACDFPTTVAEQTAGFLGTLSSGFSLISGGATEATQLAAQVKILEKKLACLLGVKQGLIAGRAGALTITSLDQITASIAKSEAKINTVTQRLDNLRARQNAKFADVMKAFFVKFLLDTNRIVTTRLVNQLVGRFKIDRYFSYTQALAMQIYAMDYVRNQYPTDTSQQLILRTILQSNFLQKNNTFAGISSMIDAKARQNLGFDVGTQSVFDSNFYNNMASAGKMQNNYGSLFFTYMSVARQAQAAGQGTAQSEIAGGQGFASNWNCGSALDQQRNIDLQTSQLLNKTNNSFLIFRQLEQNKAKPEEIEKAKKAWQDNGATLNALPEKVGSPVLRICELQNPGGFIGKSINSYLDQHLQQSSNLKADNLPAFYSFLEGVALNFVNNIISGGKNAGKNVLTDAALTLANEGVREVATLTVPKVPEADMGLSEAVFVSVRPGTVKPKDKAILTVDISALTTGPIKPARIKVTDNGNNKVLIDESITAEDLTTTKGFISYDVVPAVDGVDNTTEVIYKVEIFSDDGRIMGTKYARFLIVTTGNVQGAYIDSGGVNPRSQAPVKTR